MDFLLQLSEGPNNTSMSVVKVPLRRSSRHCSKPGDIAVQYVRLMKDQDGLEVKFINSYIGKLWNIIMIS